MLAALGRECGRAIVSTGLLETLGQLLDVSFGLDTASFTAGLLASLSLLADVEPAVAASAQQVLLQPGTAQLLVSLLASNRHSRVCTLVCHYLHHMLSKHTSKMLWQLVFDRAVQDLLWAVPGQLAQLAAYQLLSPQGQQVLAAYESEYCVDVPVALSHVLTSEQANRLIRVTAQEEQRELVEEDEGAGGEPTTKTVSLGAMASRMLLAGG